MLFLKFYLQSFFFFFFFRDAELKRAIQASLEEENQRQRQNLESEGAKGGRNEKKEKPEKKVPTSPKLNLTEDFPSLTPGTSETNTFQTQWTSRSSTNILVTNRNEEFPSLASLSVQPSVSNNSNSGSKKQGTKKSEVNLHSKKPEMNVYNKKSEMNLYNKKSEANMHNKKSEANMHKQNQPVVTFDEDFPELAAPKRRPNSASVSIVVSNAWSNSKQPNQQQQQQKVQSQKKQQQQPKQQVQKQQQQHHQQHHHQHQQHSIPNGKLLSKLSVSYNNQPIEAPALPAPNVTTVTVTDSKPAETPVMTLKDVSKILDSEENFPSLTQKKESKQHASVKVANWPVKKVTQKGPEENKRSTTEGCIVLKGKKHKEKQSSSSGENNKQNKKENSNMDSNKHSLSAECSTNESVQNSRLHQNEKPSKKKEISEIKVDVKKQKNSDADKNQKQFSTKIVLSEAEFPSLGKQEKSVITPGIKVSQVKPPPGFSGLVTNHNVKNHRPPPGLTLPNNQMKNLLNQNLPSDSGQDVQTTFHYCPPSNFEKRNKTLIGEIRDALSNDESRFGTFKSLSKDFRQGVISSREYYRQCSDLLGPERFPEILVELVCLLPDIDKQQALLLAYRDSSLLQINITPKSAWRSFEKSLQNCPICQQVLIKADYNAHLSLWHPNYDFPLESTDSWSSGTFQESTWIKAK